MSTWLSAWQFLLGSRTSLSQHEWLLKMKPWLLTSLGYKIYFICCCCLVLYCMCLVYNSDFFFYSQGNFTFIFLGKWDQTQNTPDGKENQPFKGCHLGCNETIRNLFANTLEWVYSCESLHSGDNMNKFYWVRRTWTCSSLNKSLDMTYWGWKPV